MLIGFSAVPGGQVIAHPFTKVSQDPKMPDLDIGLTQISYCKNVELRAIANSSKSKWQNPFDTLSGFSAFCTFLRKFSAFLHDLSYEQISINLNMFEQIS